MRGWGADDHGSHYLLDDVLLAELPAERREHEQQQRDEAARVESPEETL